MTDHIHTGARLQEPEAELRRSVRRWRLAAVGAFAAGAAAMAAAPVAAEPRPDHEGASTYAATEVAEECADVVSAEGEAPSLSTTGGEVQGYVYSGGSWGDASGAVPDGATE